LVLAVRAVLMLLHLTHQHKATIAVWTTFILTAVALLQVAVDLLLLDKRTWVEAVVVPALLAALI
jgi:hypothetical protein